ncbi:hypothetical protein SAMN04487944_114127 [Gracilibacillus ureilyticus]|uniref:DUF3993 domain-containing protein n=1 Tax=Gracilibacillus ureilyticus TaxID=531814 RepID=A0A1H9TR31_9BACI|nr:hypothetical protein [Gracilibacillus ureilyticus]SER99471.1 hypothetical protein SAMN04487944_114127 [Gracilibacillus ureilyticus]
MKKLITFLTIGLLFGFTALIFQQIEANELSSSQNTEQVEKIQRHVHSTTSNAPKNTERLSSNNPTLSDDKMIAMMDQFMDTLVQEIDEENRVVKFRTKDSLIDEFDSIATKEVVRPYVDYYFVEQNGELFIIPTETPAWFIKDNEYEKDTISDNKVELTQENETDLYGPYTIQVLFEKIKGQWKITNISH